MSTRSCPIENFHSNQEPPVRPPMQFRYLRHEGMSGSNARCIALRPEQRDERRTR